VNPTDPMIAELESESEATKRLLERVPADKLGWKPHPKSMTLGQLALHVATLPATIGSFLELDGLDAMTVDFQATQPESTDEILAGFEEAATAGRERLAALGRADPMAPWTLKVGEQVAFTVPKLGLARSLLLNHLYHHRGQLTVYLRILDVPLPATYGGSADEHPFAEMMKAQQAG
jgi:uncharacterized damage-inducible protein DinB